MFLIQLTLFYIQYVLNNSTSFRHQIWVRLHAPICVHVCGCTCPSVLLSVCAAEGLDSSTLRGLQNGGESQMGNVSQTRVQPSHPQRYTLYKPILFPNLSSAKHAHAHFHMTSLFHLSQVCTLCYITVLQAYYFVQWTAECQGLHSL